jgi:hypothetical protein
LGGFVRSYHVNGALYSGAVSDDVHDYGDVDGQRQHGDSECGGCVAHYDVPGYARNTSGLNAAVHVFGSGDLDSRLRLDYGGWSLYGIGGGG